MLGSRPISSNVSFLAEILDNPGDNEPRLVYADWLTEQCDPRGEFIQLQIQRQALKPGSSSYRRLRSRELALLREHEPEWAGEIPGLVRKYEFQRGFIGRVKLGLRNFLADAERLFAIAPIEQVDLKANPETDLHAIASFVESRHTAKLKSIELTDCPFSSTDVEAVCRAPFAGLRSLKLLSSHIPGQGYQRIIDASVLNGLRELDASYSNVGPQAVRAIMRLPNLQSLRLAGCPLRDAGADELAAADLSRLKSLNVASSGITAAGVSTLAQANMSELTDLVLNGASGGHLFATGHEKLNSLHLWGHELGDAELTAIAQSTQLPALTELNVMVGDYSRQSLSKLAESPLMNRLTCLGLASRRMTTEDVILVAESLKRRRAIQLNEYHSPLVDGDELRRRFGKSFGR